MTYFLDKRFLLVSVYAQGSGDEGYKSKGTPITRCKINLYTFLMARLSGDTVMLSGLVPYLSNGKTKW